MYAFLVRIFTLLAVVVSLSAQDEPPSFDELAQARDAALAGLRTTRKTSLAGCRAAYLQMLDAALKATTDAAAAAPIRKERDGIADGLVAPADAPGLSADLTAARRVFFNGVGKAAVDYDSAKRKLDAEYLKALAKLLSQSKRDRKLAAQIAAEKRRIEKD